MAEVSRQDGSRRAFLVGAAAHLGGAAFAPVAGTREGGAISEAEAQLTKSFHGVVLATKGGAAIYERAFGFADIANGAPNRLDHRFRIGSVSKTFTVALAAHLARAGAFSLDDVIETFVPGVANGGRIRLIDLIEHRSGLGDFSQEDWRRLLIERPPPTASDLMRLIAARGAKREPDKSFVYSNIGHVLLGLAIEQAAGKPYTAALSERILGPFNLADTGFAARDADIADLATGHGPKLKADVEEYDYTAIVAAGGLYSTAGDLASWCAAQDDPETPGWRRGERFGRRAIWHTGNTNDYAALAVAFPEIGASYVVLSNVGRRPPPKVLMRTLPEHLFAA